MKVLTEYRHLRPWVKWTICRKWIKNTYSFRTISVTNIALQGQILG